MSKESEREVFNNPLWLDCFGAIERIHIANDKFEAEFSKKPRIYETIDEYASRHLVQNSRFTKVARMAERAFIGLIEDDTEAGYESEVFDIDQAYAANSGFLIGLRVGKLACRKQQGLFMDSVEIKVRSMFDEGSNLSSVDLLTSQSSNFVARYIKTVSTGADIHNQSRDLNFARSYARQLGYLLPISTAFDILIDPATYFELVEGFEIQPEYPEPDTIKEFIDIAVLPTAE